MYLRKGECDDDFIVCDGNERTKISDVRRTNIIIKHGAYSLSDVHLLYYAEKVRLVFMID